MNQYLIDIPDFMRGNLEEVDRFIDFLLPLVPSQDTLRYPVGFT